jgi:hypothetical protein
MATVPVLTHASSVTSPAVRTAVRSPVAVHASSCVPPTPVYNGSGAAVPRVEHMTRVRPWTWRSRALFVSVTRVRPPQSMLELVSDEYGALRLKTGGIVHAHTCTPPAVVLS